MLINDEMCIHTQMQQTQLKHMRKAPNMYIRFKHNTTTNVCLLTTQ